MCLIIVCVVEVQFLINTLVNWLELPPHPLLLFVKLSWFLMMASRTPSSSSVFASLCRNKVQECVIISAVSGRVLLLFVRWKNLAALMMTLARRKISLWRNCNLTNAESQESIAFAISKWDVIILRKYKSFFINLSSSLCPKWCWLEVNMSLPEV